MIDPDYFLLNLVPLVMGTIFIRGFFIALSGKMQISPKVKELFTYIPAAIFPGLIFPATYFHQGSVAWLGGKERFVILLACILVCSLYRNTLLVITFGLVLLYVVTQNP